MLYSVSHIPVRAQYGQLQAESLNCVKKVVKHGIILHNFTSKFRMLNYFVYSQFVSEIVNMVLLFITALLLTFTSFTTG